MWVVLWSACWSRGLLCCVRTVPRVLCWFGVVVAAGGQLVWCPAVACMCSAGCVGLLCAIFQTAFSALVVLCGGQPLLGVFWGCIFVLLPAPCLADFVGSPSPLPPGGRLVPVSGVFSRGRPFAFGFGCAGCFGAGQRVPLVGLQSWWGVLFWLLVRLYSRACCAGARLAAMVKRAVLVPGPSPWPGVLCLCCPPLHGQTCCAGAWFAAMIGRAVLVPGLSPRLGMLRWCSSLLPSGACCASAWSAGLVWRAVLLPGPPPWVDMLCWCSVSLHGRACCGRA